jgi:hypothetical protein
VEALVACLECGVIYFCGWCFHNVKEPIRNIVLRNKNLEVAPKSAPPLGGASCYVYLPEII